MPEQNETDNMALDVHLTVLTDEGKQKLIISLDQESMPRSIVVQLLRALADEISRPKPQEPVRYYTYNSPPSWTPLGQQTITSYMTGDGQKDV